MMADEIPVIPKAESLYVHTGNIVNWNRLKRNLTKTPNEELRECLSSTVRNWVQKANKTDLQYATDCVCVNEKFVEKLQESEREGLKVTVKIFLSQIEKSVVQEAVSRALCELGTTYIETVLLSVPENKGSVDALKPAWEALEQLVSEEKLVSLGVSDLNKEQLQDLYDWAQVKPSVAQVNLSTCCVVPPEMHEFAREHDIQLLTHNDPPEILQDKALQEVLAAQVGARDGEGWHVSFIDRYSVLIKCRGVIKTKGYILAAQRSAGKRTK